MTAPEVAHLQDERSIRYRAARVRFKDGRLQDHEDEA